MSTVHDIIDCWPSPREFAADIGLSDANHVYVMRSRESIARWYWPLIEVAAQKRGFPVTQAMLVEAHHGKRQFGVVQRSHAA